MKTDTVMISKSEYKKLKKFEDLDHDLLISLVRGLEDIKAGRIKHWKSKS